MRKGLLWALGGMLFLEGCGGADQAKVPATPKWQGAPYHVSFDKPPAKPSPEGITIPAIKYVANPDFVEKRVTLVLHIDPSAAKKKSQTIINQLTLTPTDTPGTPEGALPADYMELANRELAKLLDMYCIQGKVTVSVMIARSSLSPQPTDEEIGKKKLSDWTPIDLVYKSPHPKC